MSRISRSNAQLTQLDAAASYTPLQVKATPRLADVIPRLMTLSPVAGYSANNGATTLTNPVVHPLGAGNVLLGGAQAFEELGADLAGNPYVRGTAQTGNEFPCWFAAWISDAPSQEVIYQGTLLPAFRLLINGEAVTDNSITAGGATSGAQHRMYLRFTDRRFREIRIESPGMFISSVVVTGSDTIFPSQRRRVIAFMGDSYSTSGVLGIAYTASRILGCDPMVNGSGGTGYNQAQGGAGGKQVFIDRLPNLLAAKPDYLVTMGGINDGTATLAADVAAYLALAKKSLPPERIVVLGPWRPPARNNDTTVTKRDTIRAATLAAGCHFVDNLEWLTGTGSVATPAGDGNSDIFMPANPPEIHPNGDGYLYLGVRVGMKLSELFGVAA